MTRFYIMFAFALLTLAVSNAWLSPSTIFKPVSKVICAGKVNNQVSEGRREFFGSLGVIGSAFLASQPALAAVPQEEKDKANILKGYQRLQYLLDNWEQETTVCKTGVDSFENKCDRSPLKVMDYLGYRGTNDPLFKADKTMLRLYSLAPAGKDGQYVEAVERYTENAEEASGMAYLSSWGESNPGGGKDRVDLFIERSRNNVIVARDSLETVIKILDLKP
jgi:hypothetical protein